MSCNTGMFKRARAMFAASIALGLALLTGQAQAASGNYPSRPVTIVVPFGPGGSGDLTARTFARYFEKRAGQSIVVENKPGANGIIGTQHVKSASPDGHTLLMVSNMTHAANSSLFKKLPYDPQKDFEHIGLFGVFGVVLLVPANSPFKTIAELTSYSRAKPEQVAIGHFNASTQIASVLLKSSGDMPIKTVSYRTIGNAFTDALGGHIQMVFADYPAATSHIASGKFHPVAITEAQRIARWPQVPAMAEFYPGYEIILSLGLAAPAGTPKAVLEKVNGWIVDGLQDPEVKEQLQKLGYSLRPTSVDGTRKFLLDESAKWAKYIKAANIEPQ